MIPGKQMKILYLKFRLENIISKFSFNEREFFYEHKLGLYF